MKNGQHLITDTNEVEKEWYPEDPWRSAYQWIAQEMLIRVGPAPKGAQYPIWTWAWYKGPNSRPDLRHSMMREWSKKQRHVMLTLEVPDESILISDYYLWHYCLNNLFLGTKKEKRAWQQLLSPEKENKKLDSWKKIFNPVWCRKWGKYKMEDQSLQATLWSIDPQYVRSAKIFGGGLPAERLVI